MPENVFEINAADAVSEVIEGEAIIINMSTGSYYSLDGTAGLIWELLQKGPASSATLAGALGSAFTAVPATIDAEIESLLHEMKAEGLLVDSERGAIRLDGTRKMPQPYASPVLNKYTDLEALLLLDPIHDVSPKGWPHKESSDT